MACRSPGEKRAAPFSVRNQHPVELTVLQQAPRAAKSYASGPAVLALDTDWTSHWVFPKQGKDDLRMDGETLRTNLRVGWGLGSDWDLEVEIPLIYASGGILDGFIDGFHQFFGFPQNGRPNYPRNQYEIRALRNVPGQGVATAYELREDELGFGDIPVHLAWFPVRDTHGFSLGLRASMELPTGKEELGFGNGALDWALGFSGQWDGDWLSLFGWGSYTWSGTPDRARQAGLSYQDRRLLGMGAEIFVFDGWSAIVQAEIQNSVLGNLDDPNANGNQAPIYAGFRWRMSPGVALDAGVGEDLLPNVSPDVVLHVALRFDL